MFFYSFVCFESCVLHACVSFAWGLLEDNVSKCLCETAIHVVPLCSNADVVYLQESV